MEQNELAAVLNGSGSTCQNNCKTASDKPKCFMNLQQQKSIQKKGTFKAFKKVFGENINSCFVVLLWENKCVTIGDKATMRHNA